MNKAHYIIFHPDYARQKCEVNAKALIKNKIVDWTGEIWVDERSGNEDPFVFSEPWIYSYCKAYNLRRNEERPDSYLQKGSILIFCSGNEADEGRLTVDTVFVIKRSVKWGRNGELQLPDEYKYLYNKKNDPLWLRHFQFPLVGKVDERSHTCVTHSYEATAYKSGGSQYSFLPLSSSGNRASFTFNEFPKTIINKIKNNLRGKISVLLSDFEIFSLYRKFFNTHINILSDIKESIPSNSTINTKCKTC